MLYDSALFYFSSHLKASNFFLLLSGTKTRTCSFFLVRKNKLKEHKFHYSWNTAVAGRWDGLKKRGATQMCEGMDNLVHWFPGPSDFLLHSAVPLSPAQQPQQYTAAIPGVRINTWNLFNSKIVFSNSRPPTCTSQAEEQGRVWFCQRKWKSCL